MQFLKYAYTLSYLNIKGQMYLKFNIPENIYHFCSFSKIVNSGFRLSSRPTTLWPGWTAYLATEGETSLFAPKAFPF